MTASIPMVAPVFCQGSLDNGTWTGRILDAPRFRGLLIELAFKERRFVRYVVWAESGELPGARELRQVPIDRLRRTAAADLEHLATYPGSPSPSGEHMDSRPDLDSLSSAWFRRPPDRRELRLAALAARYVELLRAPAPTKTLAEESHYSRDYVDQMLKEARDKGYLTNPPRRGVAGGELTAKALEILHRAED